MVIKSHERCFYTTGHLCRRIENGRRFADYTFKRTFSNENVRIAIKISLKFVPKGPIDKKSALVQVMDCRRFGAKPLPETMLAQFTDAYMRH